jgi:hypothetical protein
LWHVAASLSCCSDRVRCYGASGDDIASIGRLLTRRWLDDGSRWPCPERFHGFDAVRQNGSAASELSLRCASLHHGLGPHPPNTRMWHECSCYHTRAPLGLRHPDHNKCAVVLEPVKDNALAGGAARHPSPLLRAPALRNRVGRDEERGFQDRGRDGDCSPPPAQIRTCPIKAYGSYLEYLTANRALGQG